METEARIVEPQRKTFGEFPHFPGHQKLEIWGEKTRYAIYVEGWLGLFNDDYRGAMDQFQAIVAGWVDDGFEKEP